MKSKIRNEASNCIKRKKERKRERKKKLKNIRKL